MTRNGLIGLSILALATFAGQATAQAESATLTRIKERRSITIGYRESSIPFSYLGADQKPVGFSLDLCAAIVARVKAQLQLAELAVQYVPVNSSNRIPLIQNGTVDIECGGTSNSLQRQTQVSFTVATFVSQPRWLAIHGGDVTKAADLKGKTVVVTQGSNAVGFAQQISSRDGLSLNIVQAKDHAESMLMLSTGRAVAFLEDDILLAGVRAASPRPNRFAFLPEAYGNYYYGLMVLKDDTEFKALADQVLSGLMASGEFTRIYERWFVSAIPPRGQNLDFPMTEALRQRVAQPSDKVEN
jgi:glutamate/aspartate transport system substrate-binding protein